MKVFDYLCVFLFWGLASIGTWTGLKVIADLFEFDPDEPDEWDMI